jgi:DNA mismatch endonuclease, patch repair protein
MFFRGVLFATSQRLPFGPPKNVLD